MQYRSCGSLGDAVDDYLVHIDCAMSEAPDQESDKALRRGGPRREFREAVGLKALEQDIHALPPDDIKHPSRGSPCDVVSVDRVPFDLPVGEAQDQELGKIHDDEAQKQEPDNSKISMDLGGMDFLALPLEALRSGGPRREFREAVGSQALQQSIPALPPEAVQHGGRGSLGEVVYNYQVPIDLVMGEAQDQELDKVHDDEAPGRGDPRREFREEVRLKALQQDILALPPEGMLHLSRGSHGDVVCIHLVPTVLPLGEVQDQELDRVYDDEAQKHEFDKSKISRDLGREEVRALPLEALSCGGPRRKSREAVGLQALQKDIPVLPPEAVKHRGRGSLVEVDDNYLVPIDLGMGEAQDQEHDKV